MKVTCCHKQAVSGGSLPAVLDARLEGKGYPKSHLGGTLYLSREAPAPGHRVSQWRSVTDAFLQTLTARERFTLLFQERGRGRSGAAVQGLWAQEFRLRWATQAGCQAWLCVSVVVLVQAGRTCSSTVTLQQGGPQSWVACRKARLQPFLGSSLLGKPRSQAEAPCGVLVCFCC